MYHKLIRTKSTRVKNAVDVIITILGAEFPTHVLKVYITNRQEHS